MEKNGILNYLERRQLGYTSPKRKVYDLFIHQLGSRQDETDLMHNAFACKFSRNKSNLHVIGSATEHGYIIVQNTLLNYNSTYVNEISVLHNSSILNFAWAEPQMKLVTASADLSSKLCSLNPSGKLEEERIFLCDSTIQSVMFSPGSSDIFCGGYLDGSIKIFDARVSHTNDNLNCDYNIPKAHGVNQTVIRCYKTRKVLSTVIFKDENTIISSYSMDPDIKVWDLRKSFQQVKAIREPYSLLKYYCDKGSSLNFGYMDIIINPQSTYLYASGTNNNIYCYPLNSLDKDPVCQYSGHYIRNSYSKISISNDGRYIFSGCMYNGGVMWLTEFPFIEQPIFKMSSDILDFKKELNNSDWCADPSYFKLATSNKAVPMIWSILSKKEIEPNDIKFLRTESFPKMSQKRNCTTPIRVNTELRKKYFNETEQNMNTYDDENEV